MITDDGVLSASHHTVTINALDLSSSKELVSLPVFNALHSMRKTTD